MKIVLYLVVTALVSATLGYQWGSPSIPLPNPSSAIRPPTASNLAAQAQTNSAPIQPPSQQKENLQETLVDEQSDKDKQLARLRQELAAMRYANEKLANEKLANEKLATQAESVPTTQILYKNEVIAQVSPSGQELSVNKGLYIEADKKFLLHPEKIAAGKKSLPGGETSNISFTNTTADELYLFWIDYEGNATFSNKIGPNQSHAGTTSTGAIHVVTTSDGEVIEYISPIAGTDDIHFAK